MTFHGVGNIHIDKILNLMLYLIEPTTQFIYETPDTSFSTASTHEFMTSHPMAVA